MPKLPLGFDVLTAAKERISWTFDNFDRIYLSFSGGKDSTVMMHLVMDEAIKRQKKIGVMFIDWECQFDLTIDHVRNMYNMYADHIDAYWIQLEIMTNNATSMYEPTWKSWDKDKMQLWTREREPMAIKSETYFPFYFSGITFEEFTPLFGKWYSEGQNTACFVGIRAGESLNRFRTVARDKPMYQEKRYTTNVVDNVWNVYPIYDWMTEDIWVYNYKTRNIYNSLYDRMHQAGLTINQMRIDEPFGDEARKNLWIYQIIEPKTWAKFVARMNGVNTGALYSQERGNILGNAKISLPEGHSWESFANHLLQSMPPKTAEHYKNKIAKYLQWYRERGYPDGIPDQADYKLEQMGKAPAWRQIVKTLLRNDYWCRNLGFNITKSSNYNKYMNLMRRKRQEWGIFDEIDQET